MVRVDPDLARLERVRGRECPVHVARDDARSLRGRGEERVALLPPPPRASPLTSPNSLPFARRIASSSVAYLRMHCPSSRGRWWGDNPRRRRLYRPRSHLHWPEDLLARDDHAVRHPAEHRRLDEEAARAVTRPAALDARALRGAGLDVAEDLRAGGRSGVGPSAAGPFLPPPSVTSPCGTGRRRSGAPARPPTTRRRGCAPSRARRTAAGQGRRGAAVPSPPIIERTLATKASCTDSCTNTRPPATQHWPCGGGGGGREEGLAAARPHAARPPTRLVGEEGHVCYVRCDVEVRVVADDQRVLAAELERDCAARWVGGERRGRRRAHAPRLRVAAASRWMSLPTSVEPVKDTCRQRGAVLPGSPPPPVPATLLALWTPGWRTRGAPAVGPKPGST